MIAKGPYGRKENDETFESGLPFSGIVLLPAVFLGFAGITVGKLVGLRILDKINPGRIKKLVYAFVGISGVLSLL